MSTTAELKPPLRLRRDRPIATSYMLPTASDDTEVQAEGSGWAWRPQAGDAYHLRTPPPAPAPPAAPGEAWSFLLGSNLPVLVLGLTALCYLAVQLQGGQTILYQHPSAGWWGLAVLQLAVAAALIQALSRWRQFLTGVVVGLLALPLSLVGAVAGLYVLGGPLASFVEAGHASATPAPGPVLAMLAGGLLGALLPLVLVGIGQMLYGKFNPTVTESRRFA